MTEDLVGGAAVAMVGAHLATSDEPEPEGPRERLRRLHGLIHDKIGSGGDFAEAILRQVEETPGDEEPQAALAVVVAQVAINDPEFRIALEALVREAAADDGVVEIAERGAVGTGLDLVNQLREQ